MNHAQASAQGRPMNFQLRTRNGFATIKSGQRAAKCCISMTRVSAHSVAPPPHSETQHECGAAFQWPHVPHASSHAGHKLAHHGQPDTVTTLARAEERQE